MTIDVMNAQDTVMTIITMKIQANMSTLAMSVHTQKGEPMHLIDADALEREGWYLNRIIQTGKNTMEYQTKKPTEFHAIEPERKTGEWIVTSEFEDCCYAKCNQCKVTQVFYHNKPLTNFCPNCGAVMRGENYERN